MVAFQISKIELVKKNDNITTKLFSKSLKEKKTILKIGRKIRFDTVPLQFLTAHDVC